MRNDYILIKNIFKDFEVPVEFIRYSGKEKRNFEHNKYRYRYV